jgi:tetratricopeptide (TPR) repeat protein
VSRYHFNLANALRSLRQYADAIREYEAFLRLEPNSAEAFINIAVSYSWLEQLDQEAAYYEKAFAVSPGLETDAIYNHQYGWLQVVRGNEDIARAHFNKMLAKSESQRARGHRSLGILALYHGRFAEGRQHLEEASRSNDVHGVFDSAGRDLLSLGDALVLVGRTQEGLQQLDRARALFEKGSSERDAMATLANSYAHAGHASRASKILALLKAKARPGHFTDTTLVLYSEGELALARHATEEAVEKLRRARSAVDATATQLSLADGLARAGHTQEAIELYEGVVAKRAPPYNDQVRWVLAHRDLGRLYETSGRTDKARAMYQKMLDLWADADFGLQPLTDVRRVMARLGN